MRRLIGITFVVLLVCGVFVYGQSGKSQNPLVGAWKVAEIADGNGQPITNPQPSLYVFTGQHYSFARINGTKPMPDYPSNDKASDADKVAVFNMIYLNSGTYTVTGSMLTTTATMAKSKFAIGGRNQYEFNVNGNTLVLTQKPMGPVIKLMRLE
jgi:Lipocalin-like domain